ncbi:hypothetical protein MLD38_020777 [Melastoma candidum]|uniref:Uncharacterized protein n=1 Tax=Melastoma candidum TaxID=119954 RepID=A0ACB9QDI7_9MYRT|nr:hypothetical protein MLD38_020777 [Melastoma candidum]
MDAEILVRNGRLLLLCQESSFDRDARILLCCAHLHWKSGSLTSHDAAAASAFSSRLFVDLNLETSAPDNYRAPPTPLPCDTFLGSRGSYPVSYEGTMQKPAGKPQSTALYFSEMKIKLSKLDEEKALDPDEEDVCPICLEEYGIDNPKLFTSCEHHFHLSCLLEWMERSDACPMCDKVMMLESSFG